MAEVYAEGREDLFNDIPKVKPQEYDAGEEEKKELAEENQM